MKYNTHAFLHCEFEENMKTHTHTHTQRQIRLRHRLLNLPRVRVLKRLVSTSVVGIGEIGLMIKGCLLSGKSILSISIEEREGE